MSNCGNIILILFILHLFPADIYGDICHPDCERKTDCFRALDESNV